jgi:hypothetical protein
MHERPRTSLVQLRVSIAERARWLRAAQVEQLRLTELVREAVRGHVRDLERLRLLAAERAERGVLATPDAVP